VAVVSFDGLPASERSRPPLTTLRQPIPQIGETLIKVLLDQIDMQTRTATGTLIPTELIIRESSGGPRTTEPTDTTEPRAKAGGWLRPGPRKPLRSNQVQR
jgi:hypothetical protein